MTTEPDLLLAYILEQITLLPWIDHVQKTELCRRELDAAGITGRFSDNPYKQLAHKPKSKAIKLP